MATILREINVDVAQLNRFQAIVAKQYDKQSRYLKVQLQNLGENISADLNATVTINAKRSDGQAQSYAGVVNPDGTVTVPLTYWMLAIDGPVVCDISIIIGSEVMLTTTSFELQVQVAAVSNIDIQTDENYPILLELIGEVQECKQDVQEITAEYEQSADNIKDLYEASMAASVAELQAVIADAQQVIGPFYIVDTDNSKNYSAAIQIVNGKPRLVYAEVIST